MAEALPKIRVTDPQSKDSSPLERQDTGRFSTKGDGNVAHNHPNTPEAGRPGAMLIHRTSGTIPNIKITSKLWSPTATTSSPPNDETTQNGHAEGTKVTKAAIDPLSQVCTHRESCERDAEG